MAGSMKMATHDPMSAGWNPEGFARSRHPMVGFHVLQGVEEVNGQSCTDASNDVFVYRTVHCGTREIPYRLLRVISAPIARGGETRHIADYRRLCNAATQQSTVSSGFYGRFTWNLQDSLSGVPTLYNVLTVRDAAALQRYELLYNTLRFHLL
jgi:hypothetical protein